VKKKIATIAISVIIVLLVTATVIVISSEDRTVPIITSIPIGHDITYSSGEDKEKLIQYAKAVDDKDGDVSDSIKIENVYPTSDLLSVKIIYVARDKSNNIAKLSQVFKYIASQEEIDNRAKLNQKATSETSAANASVTNVTTIKSQESTKEITVVSAKPLLSLTQSEVTITQGDIFNVVQYIKNITDDKDTISTLFTRISVSGYDASKADTSKVGDYQMNIYCTDTEGNSSNTEKFTLHVKEKKAETQITTISPTQASTEKATITPTEESIEKTTETSTEKTTEAPTTQPDV